MSCQLIVQYCTILQCQLDRTTELTVTTDHYFQVWLLFSKLQCPEWRGPESSLVDSLLILSMKSCCADPKTLTGSFAFQWNSWSSLSIPWLASLLENFWETVAVSKTVGDIQHESVVYMIIAYDLPTSCAKRGGCWSESDIGWYLTPRRHLGCIPFPRKCQSELSEGCPCRLKHWSVHLSGSHSVQVMIKLFLGGLQWNIKTRDFALELPDYEFQCGVVSQWPCVLSWWLSTIAKMMVN